MADGEVHKWILEYVCRLMWEEFRETSRVSDSQRDLIQGVLHLAQPLSSNHTTNVHIKVLMLQCLLTDGEEYNTQYTTAGEDVTVLERFLKVFLEVLGSLKLNVTEFSNFISAVKEQAVLVCCRQDDFPTAKGVYDRVFKAKQKKRKSLEQLEAVLDSEDKDHPAVCQQSYSLFMEEAVKTLQKLHDKFETPLLKKAAMIRMNSRELVITDILSLVMTDEGDQNGNGPVTLTDSDINLRPEDLQTTAESLGLRNWRPGLPCQQLSVKLDKRWEKVRSDEEKVLLERFQDKLKDGSDDVVMDTVSSSSPIQQPRRPLTEANLNRVLLDSREARAKLDKNINDYRKPAARAHRYRRNRNRKDRHQLSHHSDSSSISSDIDSDLGEFPQLGPKPVLRKSLQPRDSDVQNTTKLLRVPWSESEVKKLKHGVERFGKGNWAKIRDTYNFTGRTSVNLKDKWRNIEKGS